MSAAAPETEQADESTTEIVVAAKKPVRVYFARREELVLTKRKSKRVMSGGEQVDVEPGELLSFINGKLTVPLDDDLITLQGLHIDGQEVIDFLEGNEGRELARGEKRISPHHLFGDRQEGFWLHEEVAPAITPAEQGSLIELAEERDVEGIEAFIAAEREGFNRPDLIATAEGTLERVRERLAKDAEAKAKADAEADAEAKDAEAAAARAGGSNGAS